MSNKSPNVKEKATYLNRIQLGVYVCTKEITTKIIQSLLLLSVTDYNSPRKRNYYCSKLRRKDASIKQNARESRDNKIFLLR